MIWGLGNEAQLYEEKMNETLDETCDSCGKEWYKSKNGLFNYTCPLCKETYTLCDTCSSVALKEQKCIECLNDGK